VIWQGLILAGLAAVLLAAWRYARRHDKIITGWEEEAVTVVGIKDPVSRPDWEGLAHLSRDFDALAAQIEREPLAGMRPYQDPRTLRWCAIQLRDRLGIAGSEQDESMGERRK
jgi:hypothetical protein